MTKRIFISLLVLFCAFVNCSLAQTDSVHAALQAIESLYNSGSYIASEVEARRLIEHGGLDDSAKAEIHRYIAASLIAQGKPELAKERFTMVLHLIPSYTLDPIYTSPKILAIFNEAKEEFRSSKTLKREVNQVPSAFEHTSVSFRTILFPGWEQLHTGRATSGTVFLGAGIATLGAGIALEFLRSSARQDYLSVTDPSEFNQKYDIYNRYYKAEIASFVAFAIVYVASEIDVFAAVNSPTIVQSNLLNGRGASLTFTINF
jgi:hypothetical protein